MSTNPHQILGLESPSLKEGKLADLVVINPKLNWTYEPSLGMSLSQNSPFSGYKFTGQPILTASCGKIAWSEFVA